VILHRLTSDDFQRMPWKNGGGETVQLAIWPPDAGLDHFDWRLTSANVARSGPFSLFAGVDRSLALVSGGMLSLHIAQADGQPAAERLLHPGEQLDQFAGETPIFAEVTPGRAIVDFNVMTRRARCRHRLQRWRLDGEQTVEHPLWFVYLTAGALRTGTMMLSLAVGELLWAQGEAVLRGKAEGWLVTIESGE